MLSKAASQPSNAEGYGNETARDRDRQRKYETEKVGETEREWCYFT